MINGVLIAESLRAGTALEGIGLTTRKIQRSSPGNTTADQPRTWTIIHFEAAEADAGALAGKLAEILDQPGWYTDFRTPDEIFVVFPRRIFRYPRGDSAQRAEAEAHGRSLGIPEPQLDWPE
jgi:hypothetical protein